MAASEPAPNFAPRQRSLFSDGAVTSALETLSAAGVEERGAVFARREVVEFILDLVGYTATQALHKRRILEPAFGNEIVLRIRATEERHPRSPFATARSLTISTRL